MYSDKIEDFISAVIADGQISEKERDVLHRVAAREGIDADEIDIYVDGLIDRQKAERESKRHQNENRKHGNVEKCPNCGAPIDSGAIRCPNCDYLFNNLEGNKSMERLAKMLAEVKEPENNKTLITKMFTGTALEGSNTAKKKAEIIRNFVIPTTKADLLDFTTTLLPLARERRKQDSDLDTLCIARAYFAKLQECQNRINIYFKNDPDFQILIEELNKETKRGTMIEEMQKRAVIILGILLGMGAIIGLIIFLVTR